MKGVFDYTPKCKLNQLCKNHIVEGKTGALNFKSPFYKLICSELGLKYNNLSIVGKRMLRTDAIETESMRDDNFFKEAKYYKEL